MSSSMDVVVAAASATAVVQIGNKREREECDHSNVKDSTQIVYNEPVSNESDDTKKKNKVFLNILMMNDEFKVALEQFQIEKNFDTMNIAADAFKSAIMKFVNVPHTKFTLIELTLANGEVGFVILRGACVSQLFKQLHWRIPYFSTEEIMWQLDAQFFPEQPHEFLRNWIEHKPCHKFDLKTFKLVAKFNPNYSVEEYKQLKNTIIDHVESGPQDEWKPNKTVILDRRKFKLTVEQFKVVEYLATLFPARLKTAEELMANDLI